MLGVVGAHLGARSRPPDRASSTREIPVSPLDALLASGAIDARERAAGLAYAALRRRFERSGGSRRSWKDPSGLSDEAWQALKRRHAALIRAAGAERFILDRLLLDGGAPLRSEVERVAEALGRVAEFVGGATRTVSLG